MKGRHMMMRAIAAVVVGLCISNNGHANAAILPDPLAAQNMTQSSGGVPFEGTSLVNYDSTRNDNAIKLSSIEQLAALGSDTWEEDVE
jgi:hypothetical protein